jgi:tetratricopeptide (TPR) repeat protein
MTCKPQAGFYYFCVERLMVVKTTITPKEQKNNMFNKNIKLVIAGLIIAYAIYQFVEGNIGNGISLILFSLIFIFLYFRNEMILLAFLRMRKQDMEGTQKWLDRIKNPEAALITKQQGYYNYLHGILHSQKNLTQAEKFFRKALKLGLTMDYDVAMAKLSLAGIAMQKRRKREATTLLNEAKKLDKNNMLTEQIKMMQQQMKKI